MPSTNVCWGIEIGAYAVKALKLEAADDGVNVLDYAIIPHAKVLSTPGLDQNDAIRVTLGTLVAQWDLSKAGIAISVPGQAALARFAKLPPVEPKKVPDIVKFEAAQQIPFPLDQVEWDYQTFVSPDSPDVEVGIFAITRERIMERLMLLQDVGITPDHVTLSPIAAYNALAYDSQFTEKTPGTVLLDIGTTSTDVVVAESGRVWVRTVPIGGHHFTEALVNAFKLSYPKAEKLKKEVESGANSKHIAQAMRPVFSDLAQDVQRSITYYQSAHRDAKLTRLIGLGSTFLMPGIRKFLKQQLSASVGPVDVTRVEEYKRLRLTPLGEGPRTEELRNNLLAMATCYGLALQGMAMNTVNANLMPVSIIRKSLWKDKNKWFAIAAGLAVASSAAMFIRPVQDNFAVVGASPDPLIDAVVREANDLKSKAEEAGVIGGSTVDNRPLNMMALLENRALHAFVLDDLSTMMSDARTKAQASGAALPEGVTPGFELKSFKTSYRVGFTPVGSEFKEGAGRDRGTPSGHGGGSPEGDPSAVEGGTEGQKRVVDCELIVTTSHPDARRFMLASIDKWLKDNKVRPSVPYTIVVDDNPWTMLDENQSVASSERSRPGRPGGASTGGRRSLEDDGGHGGGGHGEQDSRNPESARRGQRAQPRGDVQIIGGDGGRAAALAAALPPVSLLKPAAPAGVTTSTFVISWHVEINDPSKPAEGADAGAADPNAGSGGGGS
jgi:type IV pilus assembly protein PilM